MSDRDVSRGLRDIFAGAPLPLDRDQTLGLMEIAFRHLYDIWLERATQSIENLNNWMPKIPAQAATDAEIRSSPAYQRIREASSFEVAGVIHTLPEEDILRIARGVWGQVWNAPHQILLKLVLAQLLPVIEEWDINKPEFFVNFVDQDGRWNLRHLPNEI